MEDNTFYERTLTELDYARLVKLRRQMRLHPDDGGSDSIADALDMARLVPPRSVSPDIVTMYTQMMLEDCVTGRQFQMTVCYPSDAEPAAGFISVMSPVGASVLGLRVGCTARWVTPSGDAGAAEVIALLFQPEASGDYTL